MWFDRAANTRYCACRRLSRKSGVKKLFSLTARSAARYREIKRGVSPSGMWAWDTPSLHPGFTPGMSPESACTLQRLPPAVPYAAKIHRWLVSPGRGRRSRRRRGGAPLPLEMRSLGYPHRRNNGGHSRTCGPESQPRNTLFYFPGTVNRTCS